MTKSMQGLLTIKQVGQLSKRGVEYEFGDLEIAPIIQISTRDNFFIFLIAQIDPDDEDIAFGVYSLGEWVQINSEVFGGMVCRNFPRLARLSLSYLENNFKNLLVKELHTDINILQYKECQEGMCCD